MLISFVTRLFRLLPLMGLVVLAACSSGPPDQGPDGEAGQIALLAAEIQSLGPDVDPEEASRAAALSYSYTRELAIAYEITDPPLIHNSKVNMGLRPRGLCWHWAEDMERRLKQENFRTLELHRAIANADRALLIEHSTAILSAKGDPFEEGIVLDPWRWGGKLFWGKVSVDTRYRWVEQSIVLNKKREDRLRKEAREAFR